jgi:hypothetical protein
MFGERLEGMRQIAVTAMTEEYKVITLTLEAM